MLSDSERATLVPSLPTGTLATVLSLLPEIGSFVGRDVDDIVPVIEQELRVLPPVPLVAFVGPSGAGKSTLFKLATGVDTATGKAVWPCSFVPCAAIPTSLSEDGVAALLPGLDLVRRHHADDARDEGAPLDRVLFADSRRDGVIVCDLPDIDGTVPENHERARKIVRLADRLVFTCSRHNYASRTALESLAEFLAMFTDGEVVILLTQLEAREPHLVRASAERVVDDLAQRLFQEHSSFRAEDTFGMPLLEKARRATYAYSPYSREPSLESVDILGSPASTLSLKDLLKPENLRETRQQRQLLRLGRIDTRVKEVIRAFQSTAARVDADIQSLKALEERAFPRKELEQKLRGFLPVGTVLQITIETAQSLHTDDTLARSLGWPGKQFRKAVQGIASRVVSRGGGDDFGRVITDARRSAADLLLRDGNLTGSDPAAMRFRYDMQPTALAGLADKYLGTPIPDQGKSMVDGRWRLEVAKEAEEWCREPENRFWLGVLLYVAPVLTPILVTTASLAIVVDVLHGGLGTGLIVAAKALGLGGFLFGGSKALDLAVGDVRHRLDRIRGAWVRRYRRQLIKQLHELVTYPYVGKQLRGIAVKRDALLPKAAELSKASRAIEETCATLEGVMGKSGVNA
jgi:hypothetical protein